MLIMAKKIKRKLKIGKGKSAFKKELDKELKDVEKFVHERKKFLKKLGWIVILIILLIIISNLYLKVSGVGI